ncbi:hypothetical protein [Streptomyces sp. enrichment culture]|uniref:hypothetical protein n=1 Tax=Streptomyces sp. enrichment culture TaxID=1795815 RepID=UPI003F54A8A0
MRNQTQIYPAALAAAAAALGGTAAVTPLAHAAPTAAAAATRAGGTTPRRSLHTELARDPCPDVPGGDHRAGTGTVLRNPRRRRPAGWLRGGATLPPAAAPDLCPTAAGRTRRAASRLCDGTPAQRFPWGAGRRAGGRLTAGRGIPVPPAAGS